MPFVPVWSFGFQHPLWCSQRRRIVSSGMMFLSTLDFRFLWSSSSTYIISASSHSRHLYSASFCFLAIVTFSISWSLDINQWFVLGSMACFPCFLLSFYSTFFSLHLEQISSAELVNTLHSKLKNLSSVMPPDVWSCVIKCFSTFTS